MKRRRKRKTRARLGNIYRTAITVNRDYFDVSPEHIDKLLPEVLDSGVSETILGMPVLGGMCGLQHQLDSGDVFLFLRTRWRSRSCVGIYRYLEESPASYSPVVFAMTHEAEMDDFDKRLGYDVSWDMLSEIEWSDFCVFVSRLLSDSLACVLKQPEVSGADNLKFVGDLRWIPPVYREGIAQLGVK